MHFEHTLGKCCTVLVIILDHFKACLHTLVEQQQQGTHADLHTAKCISMYAHAKRNITEILEKYSPTPYREVQRFPPLWQHFCLRICIGEPI